MTEENHNEGQNGHEETTISKSSYFTLGVVILIVMGAGYVIRTETRLNGHISDPVLHHNIINSIQRDYVTRQELDSRFANIDTNLTRIQSDLKEILKFIRDN